MHLALTHQDLLFANVSKDSLVMVQTARRLKHATTQKIAATNLQTAFCSLVWFHVSVAQASLEMELFAEVNMSYIMNIKKKSKMINLKPLTQPVK